ncbi:conserved hypothetical protein [Talaromyces stipitatus ATCC 10500]|uniref:Uncharacterized protein n=1 Tax=Talaromyces stipitatus (strain ATCC 10500 / CBS 375.48 / QM 6759 / NRRL 1006) TaxID=441959 RepID=B8MD63_TALSN|nr:uncharacterized protein TSTA_114020 [Talaromyces stipitatus ATCC 10500]EED17588.1 conserved hypothetical protein [Talaromyces stipitatus ATCC 10500]
MPSLPVMIAVAVGCSVLLIVSVILGVAVWWRKRQDRLSLAVAQVEHCASHQGQACSSFVTDSPLTSPLPTYPYGTRQEWAPLGSQEKFQRPPSQPKTSPPPPLKKEKSKSIRRSISKSLSKSLSIGRSNQKSIHMESLPNLQPGPQKIVCPVYPDAKEKEPKSAIAGFSELPTEITPRNTPERERDDILQLEMYNSQPGSTAWPLLHSEQRLSSVAGGQPTYFDQNHTRLRNGSITAQTAGIAPDMPMPPTPLNISQSYQFPREDSLMGMSSLSVETANSSILDGNLRRSMSVDHDFNYSPSLPPCPTFTPFSPYDIVIGGSVAQDCASHRRTQSQRLSSSTAHLTSVSMESGRGDPSPRRSLTTREVSPQPPDWASRLPRRGETVLSSASSAGHTSSRPVSSISGTSPNAFFPAGQGLYSRQEFGPQSHRQERYSMYERSKPREEPNMIFSQSLGDRPKSTQAPGPRGSRDSFKKAPLPSAMKSAQSVKKGHRRQNCVRISIHPPITFGGPAFSPMLEEPEEVDASPDTNSRIPRPQSSRKRARSRADSVDDVFTSENRIVIPNNIFARPPDENQLLTTPSPERHKPLWSLPRSNEFSGSSPKFPVNASTGSPRRPAPKGPRNQPDRQQKKTEPPSSLQIGTSENGSPDRESPTKRGVNRSHTLTASPTKDVRKSITLLRRMNSEACDEDSRSYRRMGRNASITRHSDRNIRKPPSNRNSVLSNDSLIIWEDASEDGSVTSPIFRQKNPPPFKLLERIDSENTVEENMNVIIENQKLSTIRQVPPSSSIMAFEDRDQDNNSDSSDEVARKRRINITAMQTPSRKVQGYASAAATPGSLYDRDGFLKE